MEKGDSGAQRCAGQECPALKTHSASEWVTPKEREVITRFLMGAALAAGGQGGLRGQAGVLALAILKFLAFLLLSTGIVAGYADGNDMDDVGCTVAMQPGGARHPTPSGQLREKGEGKLPTAGGSSGTDGPGGRPPGGRAQCGPRCERRTETGECRRLGGTCCWLVGMGMTVGQRGVRDDDVAEMLAGIHREIAAVRTEHQELKSAKERLEKMLAGGFFEFTKKVDATSFKVLCTILAEGDVAKSSRTLAMPDASMRTLMRRWRRKGKEYRTMLDLVRWRKAVGRKETVALSDNVLLGKADREDYPEVLSDVLEKVTEMTGENWEEKAEQLEEMLRAIV